MSSQIALQPLDGARQNEFCINVKLFRQLTLPLLRQMRGAQHGHPPYLASIQARTLIVQGDRDPLYPVELSVEMAKAIPLSSLWIIPNAGHGPVLGERWPEFLKIASGFLALPAGNCPAPTP